jgi:ferredoxin-NADP reductase
MPVVRKLACRVRSIADHGDHVYTVDLDTAGATPRFIPGQFLHLALDAYDGGFWPDSRVFSIATSPDERDRLGITYAVKGEFTSRMERELEPGREVWVKLPYGTFTVDAGRDAVLFAGGTGVTAFTAFIASLPADHPQRVALLYGARSGGLFVYGDVVCAAAGVVPNLTVDLVDEEQRGRLAVEPALPMIRRLNDPLCYLSGPPPMIAALTSQLQKAGVGGDHIRVDAWE